MYLTLQYFENHIRNKGHKLNLISWDYCTENQIKFEALLNDNIYMLQMKSD